MGGTNRKETGKASNGLYVHLKCHANVESSRMAALENGWLLHQQADPATTPIKLWHGWVILDNAGASNPVPQETNEGEDDGQVCLSAPHTAAPKT